MDEKINLLVVDDSEINRLTVGKIVEAPDCNIVFAESGEEAVEKSTEMEYALILMDVRMPGMDGFEAVEKIRENPATAEIPVIFVTAIHKTDHDVFKGYDAGAIDYIFKPVSSHILRAKTKQFIDIYKQKKAVEEVAEDLRVTVMELKKANARILDHQKTVIEEDRLKTLLQIAGAAAYELNEPLADTMGLIYMMKMAVEEGNIEQTKEHLELLEGTALNVSDIVKNMQYVRRYETKTYANKYTYINFDQKANVLLGIESLDNLEKIRELLEADGRVNVFEVPRIVDMLEEVRTGQYSIVFIEYGQAGEDVVRFLKALKEAELGVHVIGVTEKEEEIAFSQMVQAGVIDYFPMENLDEKLMARVIGSTLEKARLQGELDEARKKLHLMSMMDDVTGLHNRQFLVEALDREVARALRFKADLLLCDIDIDHLKVVNDNLGIGAGDLVLAEIGKMLKDSIRESDHICRFTGDDISIIMTDTTPEKAIHAINRFREKISEQKFEYNSTPFQVTISIGIASLLKSGAKTSDELIKMAEKALEKAKIKRNAAELY